MTESHVLAMLLPLCALLLPIAMTLYIVRKAQRVTDTDRVAIWFSCVRFMRWLLLGTLLAWWVATDLVRGRQWFESLLFEHGLMNFQGALLLFQILFWIPPVLVVVSCQVLLQPVYSGVRGIVWTRSELAGQVLLSLGAAFLPLLLIASGISGVFEHQTMRGFAFALVLAFVCAIFFGRRLRKALQLSPNALTTGELRDRAFYLASQLRIKLQQVYLLPPGKNRLANAYARSGHSILLTHYLLSHLTRREVDTVIAHELAHLKHDHPRLLGFALMGGFAAVCVPYFFYSLSETWQPLFDILFVTVPLLTYYFVARRCEFTADATSVRVTGDPEAMITSLVKLHRLNLLPLQWGKWNEKLLTHPSTVRRANAIARAANLPEQLVAALLQEAQTSSSLSAVAAICDEHYPLPSPESLGQKVFSTEFKQSLSSRSFLLSFAMIIVMPALLLRGLAALGVFSSGFPIFVVALLLGVALFLLFLNFVPFFRMKKLQQKMFSRALAEGIVPKDKLNRREATLVGLSPGPAPRIFEGNYSWDVGYLYFAGDRLCYCGEETKFTLRRKQILAAKPGPGMPGWFRARSLYIVWRDADSGSSAIFSLRPLAVCSVLSMNRAVKQLFEQVQCWRSEARKPSPPAEDISSLPLPEIRAVTGTSLAEAAKSPLLLGVVVYGALFSGFFASFLNLPFGGLFAVLAYDPDSAASAAGFSGWYAVLCAAVLALVFVVPLLRARNTMVTLPAAESGNPPPRTTD